MGGSVVVLGTTFMTEIAVFVFFSCENCFSAFNFLYPRH